ncbi:hypothetical protein PIB30_077837 [Stylosanthes scabra]|uniref:Uncharacterized protein n=1 Tax=Stylosanthes scabra TaxID=79078 RepID=A0ABU6SQT0_9FABA|nr:hypothetical protein [Stylosanthes scabra]
MRKTKKRVKTGHWRGRTPDSAAARPENANFSAPGATVSLRSHALRARAMTLARPHGELGHIRPKISIKNTMDKKGIAKRSVCKMYASQAAARNEASLKPPTAPKAPEEPKKKPIFIDLTVDSEPEDTTRASSETHFSSVASCSEGHSAPR